MAATEPGTLPGAPPSWSRVSPVTGGLPRAETVQRAWSVAPPAASPSKRRNSIDTATSGSLKIGGMELTQMPRSKLAAWRADTIGYIFQLYNLVPVLTAYENVELPLLLTNLSDESPTDKQGEAMGLRMLTYSATSVVMPIAFGSVGALLGQGVVLLITAGVAASGAALSTRLERGQVDPL